MRLFIFYLSCLATVLSHSLASSTEEPKTVPGHSHNDYEHPKPFNTAIDYGFRSLEADVIDMGEDLMVAHSLVQFSPERNLSRLYLSPLLDWAKLQSQNPKNPKALEVWLFVDIKNNTDNTIRILKNQLLPLMPYLTRIESGQVIIKAVRIIVSGRRPSLSQLPDYIFLDGRPSDLGPSFNGARTPVVSEKWPWSSFEKNLDRKVAARVQSVHKRGALVRFWESPDNEAGWRLQLKAGVDLINTDRIKDFHQYFMSQPK